MKEISSYLFCLCKAVIFILPSSLYAQNLVINPSFEDFTQCPTAHLIGTYSGDRISYASGWSTANHVGLYFHSCVSSGNITSVPSNVYGYQYAATGDGYAGITYLGGTTLGIICGKLNSPLTVGASYTVSMKVSAADKSNRLINNVGVDFSLNQVDCFGPIPAPSCALNLPYTPPLYTHDIITDTANWVTLSWTYTATAPYSYLSIGVFDPVVNEILISNTPDQIWAIIYVDDVSVVPVPACTVSVNATKVSCQGGNNGTAEAVVGSGTGPFNYVWSPVPGGGQGTSQITGLTAQDYTVTVTNAQGSCTAMATIMQPDSLLFSLEIDHASCGPNGGASAMVEGGTAPYTYSWNNGISSGLPEVSGLSSGTYTVVVADAAGCTRTETFEVGEEGLLIVVLPQPAVILEGSSIQLTAQGALNYSWSPPDGLSCTLCPDPQASPLETTVYTVTGTDSNGCSGTISVIVTVNYNCPPVFVPTIFSPNGDGNNDQLLVLGGCIKRMNFEVYNRWGESVFKTGQLTEGWDGNFKGAPSAAGAYVYRLNADFKNGEKISLSGSVTLVR